MTFFLQNWYLVLAALVSGGLLAWPLIVGRAVGGQVTPAEAVMLINRERAVLIDVGDAAAFGAGHAVGAKHVPLASLPTSGALPRNKSLPVVLVCGNGQQSIKAAAVLRERGHERAAAMTGGLAAWRAANLPVESAAA